MEVGYYHILKEKDAVSFTKVEDSDDIKVTIKQFDPLTGEKLDNVEEDINVGQVDDMIKQVDQSIKNLDQSMKNLITLKDDLGQVK